jgi:3-methyl-2-oxobutanoate hydroxymethyltransferase
VNKQSVVKRLTTRDIHARKNGEPIVVLTAYTAPITHLLDPYCDMLLVGDTLGMVVYGMDSTLGVTLDMMINHGKAVVRSSRRACVMVDMPFGSYQESPAQAFRNAARILAETGAAAVKLEGGIEMEETIRFLVERGVPVVGHIGLRPQSINIMGGFRTQGKNEAESAAVLADAEAVARAGAFALVIEGTIEGVARHVTGRIAIPTIGIGASPACDGQVLVIDDVLGLAVGPHRPKFVKQYADLSEQIDQAVRQYSAEVKARAFPGPEHCYGMNREPR